MHCSSVFPPISHSLSISVHSLDLPWVFPCVCTFLCSIFSSDHSSQPPNWHSVCFTSDRSTIPAMAKHSLGKGSEHKFAGSTSFSLRASYLFFSVGNSRAIRAWWWWRRRRTCQILPHFHQLSVLFLPHLLFFPSSPSAPTIHPHCKYPMNGDLPRGWVCFLDFPDPDGELVESVKLVWVVDALEGGLFQKSHTIKAWQNISLPYCSVLNIISQQLITRSRENAQKGDANCGSRLPHPCMWLLILVTTLNRDHALHAFKFDSK